jgi:hypothetical protein
MDDHRQRVVDRYQHLDEGLGPFRYFHFPHAGVDGYRYWFKAVEVDEELVAIRQVQRADDGTALRYWWRHLDDADGMLTDQPLHPDEGEDIIEIPTEDFERAWETVDGTA